MTKKYSQIQLISADKIFTSPQPRKNFDEEKLLALAENIKQLGDLIHPIRVKQVGTRYEIVSGERRYRAALLAGLIKIPVTLATDVPTLYEQLSENFLREDLSPDELAAALSELQSSTDLSVRALAEQFNVPPTTMHRKLHPPTTKPKTKPDGEPVSLKTMRDGRVKLALTLQPKTQTEVDLITIIGAAFSQLSQQLNLDPALFFKKDNK